MNEQLYADLSDDRFITAWFGVLDAKKRELRCFSAGQGPVLHYVRARDEFVRIGSDAPPLGILERLPISLPPPIRLERGDLFLVLTDGIIEARGGSEEEFGVERLEAVVRAHRSRSPRAIVVAVREAVEEYTSHAPPDDDRTVLLIKRV
jgi:sigma-B regulation protein RsbU (phosphoserine phosphatase)